MARIGVAICMLGLWTGTLSAGDDALAKVAEGIRVTAAAYVEAFNRHDAQAVSQFWTEDGVYTDRQSGARTTGRAAILADLEETFRTQPHIRLQFSPGEIRMIRPDVALAESTATIVLPGSEPTQFAVSALFTQSGDKWQLTSAEELPVPAPETAREALQPLEWLIGQWEDESEDVLCRSTFRWGRSDNFLIRSFYTESADGESSEGTQVIGWDPRARQIRSWTFNADGSFGEALWSRNGGDWLVKSTQTLVDGGAASGTYVITPLGADEMTVRLIGHEINGEPQPAGPTVRVTRLPDAAQATPPSDEKTPEGDNR